MTSFMSSGCWSLRVSLKGNWMSWWLQNQTSTVWLRVQPNEHKQSRQWLVTSKMLELESSNKRPRIERFRKQQRKLSLSKEVEFILKQQQEQREKLSENTNTTGWLSKVMTKQSKPTQLWCLYSNLWHLTTFASLL